MKNTFFMDNPIEAGISPDYLRSIYSWARKKGYRYRVELGSDGYIAYAICKFRLSDEFEELPEDPVEEVHQQIWDNPDYHTENQIRIMHDSAKEYNKLMESE